MKVCSLCGRCYEDAVSSCVEAGHPELTGVGIEGPDVVSGYHFESVVHSGLDGHVFRAHQNASGRSCLIRILPIPNDESRERFVDESKLAAAFFHPNVADVYEAGILETGEPFVVAEDTDARTLREHLSENGPPDLLTTIAIVLQTAEALHALHLRGIKHRAVSPDNIVLSTGNNGQARARIKDPDLGGLGEHAIVSNKFLIDSALDSIRYFAPEQFAGEPSDPRTDVYSLGIVFYEMLSGAPPFESSKAAGLIEKHRHQAPPEVRINNFDLRMLTTHALMESLAKQPWMRQSSANAFARQLRHIEQLAAHTSTPPPASVVPRPTRAATIAMPPPRPPIAEPSSPVAENPAGLSPGFSEPAAELTAPLFEETTVDAPAGSAAPPPPRSRLKVIKRKLHSLRAVASPSRVIEEVAEAELPETIDAVPRNSVAEEAGVPPIENAPIPFEPGNRVFVPALGKSIRIKWDRLDEGVPAGAHAIKAIATRKARPVSPRQPRAVPFDPIEIPMVEEIRPTGRWSEKIHADDERSRPPVRRATAVPAFIGMAGAEPTDGPHPPEAILSEYSISQTGRLPVGRAAIVGGVLVLGAAFAIGNFYLRDRAGWSAVSANSDSTKQVSVQPDRPAASRPMPVLVRDQKVMTAERGVGPTMELRSSASSPKLEARSQPSPKNAASGTSLKNSPPVSSVLAVAPDKPKPRASVASARDGGERRPSPKQPDRNGVGDGSTRPRIVAHPKP